jgi:hypothetical protein
MAQDKQVSGVNLNDVLQKRRLGQALNAKEFAVLVGVSYSTARGWFRLPGFPVLRGFIFWSDFVQWRRRQTGLDGIREAVGQEMDAKDRGSSGESKMPPRAALILAEAG